MDVRPYLSRHHVARLGGDAGGAMVATVEGTLVFADVSGFTALSERLARHGKVGAEELTDVVNAAMGGLLAAAAPYGADLLKYGGDALLLLFDGDGHEVRGVAAAAAMQAIIESTKGWRSGDDRVQLRMSVGVEAGSFDVFLVGALHRELVVAGGAATAALAFEHEARAGEVLVGPIAAAALPDACCGQSRAGGVLLAQAPPTRRSAFAPLRVTETDVLRHGVPVALRDHLGSAVDGEHRSASVAFVQFRGLEQMDPEPAAAALHTLVVAGQVACDANGVTFLATDVDVAAGKLIFLAGVPVSHADDEDRLIAAVRATLAAALGGPLRTRAGVNRGRLFAVEVGNDERRVFTVLGDAVNLAARVMDAAEDGDLLATDEVLDRVATPYRRIGVPPFHVKGKVEAVRASVVGPVDTEVVIGVPTVTSPLVGRAAERVVLLEAVSGSSDAATCAVELVGPAGIGKTRLVAEACAAAGGRRIVFVEGSQYASTTLYRAVRDALRDLVGTAIYDDDDTVIAAVADHVRRLAPELEPLLPLVITPFGAHIDDTPETAAIGPNFRRTQVQIRTTELLSALLPPAGLLVVEDAHYLDEGSGELLAHLLTTLQDLRWAVISARRPEATTFDLSRMPGVTVLEIGRLTAAEARTLAAERAEGYLDAAVMETLVERAGGNPLFLRELVGAARRGASIDELPPDIEAVVAAHVDTYPPAARTVLRTAAVLGSRFPRELLLNLVGGERASTIDTLAGLTAMVESDGIDQMRFVHHLVREVAYEALPYKRRRALHGMAGDLIVAHAGEETGSAEPASLHFHRAGRWKDSWEWSARAARRSIASAAPREALTFFDRAIEASRRCRVNSVALADLRESEASACARVGEWERAAAALRATRRLTRHDPERVARTLLFQSDIEAQRTRYGTARRYLTMATKVVGLSPQSEILLEVPVSRAGLHLRHGRADLALPVLHAGIAAARQAHNRSYEGRIAYMIAWAQAESGRADDGGFASLAVSVFEEDEDFQQLSVACNNAGGNEYFAGHWTAALDLYRRAQSAAAKVGDLPNAAMTGANIGELLLDQGLLDEAGTTLDVAINEARRAASLVPELYALGTKARWAVAVGHSDAAPAGFAAAIDGFRAIGASGTVAEFETRACEALVFAGRSDDALAEASRLAAVTDRATDRARLVRVEAWADAQQGRTEQALGRLTQALASDIPYEAALTHLAEHRIRTAAGEQVTIDAATQSVLNGLGVVWVPFPPLPGLPAVLGGRGNGLSPETP